MLSEKAKKLKREYARQWREKNKKHVQEYQQEWKAKKLKSDPDYFNRKNREFWERQAKEMQ